MQRDFKKMESSSDMKPPHTFRERVIDTAIGVLIALGIIVLYGYKFL